jgi:hypothetical protein
MSCGKPCKTIWKVPCGWDDRRILYSLGCDSTELFDGTKISESADYKKYMNKYNVIHLDIASVWDFHKEDLVESFLALAYITGILPIKRIKDESALNNFKYNNELCKA